MKYCPKCEASKSKSEFGKNAEKDDGLQGYCLECMREYARSRRKPKASGRAKKTADIQAYRREYNKANRDRLNRLHADWMKAHPEYAKEKGRRKYERKMKRLHGESYEVGAKENLGRDAFLTEDERKQAYRARRALRKAVERGKIVKHPCQVCGNSETEGHHPDYSAPLAVVWLCKTHHDDTHQMHRELTSI